MRKIMKKWVLICATFMGISLVTTAAVTAIYPFAQISKATTDLNWTATFDVSYLNATHLTLLRRTDEGEKIHAMTTVTALSEPKIWTVSVTDLEPGVHTFIVRAVNLEHETSKDSTPFSVVINDPQP